MANSGHPFSLSLHHLTLMACLGFALGYFTDAYGEAGVRHWRSDVPERVAIMEAEAVRAAFSGAAAPQLPPITVAVLLNTFSPPNPTAALFNPMAASLIVFSETIAEAQLNSTALPAMFVIRFERTTPPSEKNQTPMLEAEMWFCDAMPLPSRATPAVVELVVLELIDTFAATLAIPKKALLTSLPVTDPVTLSNPMPISAAGLTDTTLPLILANRFGEVAPLAKKIPKPSTSCTLLFCTVTNLSVPSAFSAQIPTPQPASDCPLALAWFTVPEEPGA